MNRYYPDWETDCGGVVAYLNDGGCGCGHHRPHVPPCPPVPPCQPCQCCPPMVCMGTPGPAVPDLTGTENLCDVIGTINALLASLRAAGVIAG